MADNSDSDAEKTEEPTAHRIDEFRRRGEVASSKELTSVIVLATVSFTLFLSMAYIYEEFEKFLEWIWALNYATAFTPEAIRKLAYNSAELLIKCTGPVFLISTCVGILATVAQIGFLFSTDVLTIKLERINPINGMQKLLTFRSAVEAIKGLFKFSVIISIVYIYLRKDILGWSGFLHLEPAQSLVYGGKFIIQLMFAVIAGLGIIALFDLGYQKYSYRKKLMMTKEEARKEAKEQDGSPEVRQRIKSIQRQMAQKRMIADIPKADVIVANPTHISIALKYDPETMISPEVLAKGADFMALRIREIAKEHQIPIVENVSLARTLYKTVKVREAVPRSLYKAVAEVLAFVYKLKKKKKALE